ncbi:bifunctional 6-phosphofructo-2-kinase/fructose-2,6-bisphosphate 2-phosphatase [Ascobolus immersus RN42]|uniref:fructose-2,6-bisphosphate 2-phosphatase n=1 Tax=Ascobolus immersus RN42 TaxID=1160509 RepID=A0A3N4IJ78_ASCIM|nr:bifunctional 6-phosphofructo-2-kinase/fructose-2,6-bisphosphate 2-phosphatase [Ascobolus immersus RN42]
MPRVTNGSVDGIQVEDVRIVVVMVGLPARGKSLIAQKIVRYLSWLSIYAKAFNVGSYRRQDNPAPNAEFFSTGNTQGEQLRKAAAEAAVADMIEWFENEGGVVAVLDATNSTKERRRWIAQKCDERGYEAMFVESVCDHEEIILGNILEVKTTSPDYKDMDPETAVLDFKKRITHYEAIYETITETDLTYVKLINVGSQVIINRIQDYLQSRIVYFLMNLHIKPRSIWLSRHGESEFNLSGRIGGDADLSARGRAYAQKLPELIRESIGDRKITLWTSTLKRTIQTAEHLPYPKLQWKGLDELDAGVCDGLTYKEIEEKYPEDFKARDDDKYNYRYRGGESYRDVVTRLEPIIMEMERNENIMVVTHQAVIRCIYAYFMNVPQDRSPWMEIPLHTVIKLTPKAYHTEEERFFANIPAVSTFRAKHTSAKMEGEVQPELVKTEGDVQVENS